MALQLAKFAGLRVICIADLYRHGARLHQSGADVLVDRHDNSRAVEIIHGVTQGKLRFALDTVGKETVSYLQQTLDQQQVGSKAHLVGLTGLPENPVAGIRHHIVPIKIFHSIPAVGERIMTWLEQLLEAKVLAPPIIQLAAGGLEGINDALDQLRDGKASGKRIVVPLEGAEIVPANVPSDEKGSDDKLNVKIGSIEYAEKLNADPERIKFA